MAVYTDAASVEQAVKSALAFGQSTPDLSQLEIDRLLASAKVGDAWETSRLDAAIANGWMQKAAKASGLYDIGVGNGKYFKRSTPFDRCVAMAASYRDGDASIDTELGAQGGSDGISFIRSDFLTGGGRDEWS